MAKVLLEEAKRIADTVMEEHPGLISKKWSYDVGLLLTGMERLYQETGEEKYYEYLKAYFDYFILPDGTIRNYDCQEKNIDHVNCGKTCSFYMKRRGRSVFGSPWSIWRSRP